MESSWRILRDSKRHQRISEGPVKDVPTGILRLHAGKSKGLEELWGDFKFNQKRTLSPQSSVSVSFAPLDPIEEVATMQEQLQLQEFPDVNSDSDEDDYSASAKAIIERRASTRRSKKQSRRTSSPFISGEITGPERRRSSVFTTSSGDTAITVDENAEVTQDVIFENIKLHKEVLNNVKMQPWNMRKKLKLVVQAKSYIKKHEGQLQERLAQSHSTKDMLARWNIVLIKKWQKWKRELTNMSMWFIPWELKIKEIESHFGSVVASYFIFLRWLFWVNIVISATMISFVTIPEIIIADTESVKDRKFVLPEDKYSATNFLTLWEFQGVVKYSPLFYGWYTNRDYNGSTNFASFKGNHHKGYWLPFAYFITGLVVYAYSFFAILRKMAENSRMSKLSEKDDECIFSWKLFTAWDYMIGNAETAHNRMASIVMGFKEALLEEAEKKRESRNWRIIGFRVLVNIIVLGLLSCSAFAVVIVVKRSTEAEAKSTLWRTNEVTVVINFITYVFPMLFEVLGYFEQYHPRMQLRTQLGRIMVLNLLNLYALIITLFFNIREMTTTLNAFKTNLTKLQSTDVVLYSLTSPTSDKFTNFSDCFCNESAISSKIYSLDMSSLAEDLSTISLPTITTIINNYFTSNFSFQSEQYENVTLTSYIDNITEYFQLNTSSNSIFNATDSLSFNDLTNFFNDYLAYLLLPFNISDDSTDNSTTMSFNESITTENSTFEYFKTTLLPLLNSTQVAEEYEERFDTELRTFFEEISSTISSLPNLLNSTDSSTEKTASSEHWSCQRYCKEFNGHILSTTPTNLDEIESKKGLSYEMKSKLRSLCWETMFGQELIRLTLMDLIVTGLVTLLIDFFRGIFVRVMNKCWCWDLEKKFPQYGEFKVAENILHLVNNQGMVWMGMFFSPGLVALNVIKLYILMYLRAWAVLTCNVPHEIIFRASRSNNFYYALLLLMLLLCVGPVGYTVVWIEPSWHCGPFSGSQRIFHIFTNSIKTNVPSKVYDVLDYIASPGVVIPLLLLLILIIYYLVSLTGALREANNDLKVQLRRERTVERRKMFQLADRRRRGGSGESTDQTPFSKWKKLLSNLPSNAHQESEDIVHSQHEEDEIEHAVENKGKISFTRLIKKTMGKASTSDEEDATDTEQHDSLPYENEHSKKTASDESSDFPMLQNIVSKWSLKRNKEMEVMVNNAKRQNLQEDPGMKQIDKARNQDRKEKTVKMKKESDLGKKIVETKKIGVFNDNESSTRSENIPVITISKTSSDDNMLKDTKLVSEPPSYHAFSEYVDEMNEPINFRPRVKCALKKQAIAIDEDIIIHFGDELQKRYAEKQAIFDLVSQKIVETGKIEDIETLSESSSKSSELKDDNSVDTILNCPCFADDDNVMSLENDQNVEENLEIQRPSVESSSRSQTESSTCYKE